MSDIISIFITDDHAMLRQGLVTILQQQAHMRVTGDFNTGHELLQGLRREQPDILLLDLNMPGISGEELVPQLRQLYPKMKIIILTGNDSAFIVRKLLEHGIHGYLLKNSEQDLLVQAIMDVYAGQSYISPELQERILSTSKEMKDSMPARVALTSREVQLLNMIANELSSQQIADELDLNLRTVEKYRTVMMQKLGVMNVAGAVKKGMLLGLIK